MINIYFEWNLFGPSRKRAYNEWILKLLMVFIEYTQTKIRCGLSISLRKIYKLIHASDCNFIDLKAKRAG